MNKEKTNSKINIFCIISLIVFGTLFLAGTFFDEQISETLYTPKEPVSMIISAAAMYIFFGIYVFFYGCMTRQIFSSDKSKFAKAALSSVCLICGALTSWISTSGLLKKSCLGVYFDRPVTDKEAMAAGLLAMFPLFFIGFFISVKKYDRHIVRELLAVIIFMTLAFLIPLAVKAIFLRPRFLITKMELENVDYQPWYVIDKNMKALKLQYDLEGDDFSSFPSSHSIDAFLDVMVFPALALVMPKLENKKRLLFTIAAVSAPFIMLSRIVLGAHFLSDVSFGALTGVILYICYSRVKEK